MNHCTSSRLQCILSRVYHCPSRLQFARSVDGLSQLALITAAQSIEQCCKHIADVHACASDPLCRLPYHRSRAGPASRASYIGHLSVVSVQGFSTRNGEKVTCRFVHTLTRMAPEFPPDSTRQTERAQPRSSWRSSGPVKRRVQFVRLFSSRSDSFDASFHFTQYLFSRRFL